MDDQVFQADWTVIDGRAQQDVQIVCAEGKIKQVGNLGLQPTERISGLLLPGFVNAHSHAFQIGLRGLAEQFPSEGGNFWIWRDEMYKLVHAMDDQRFLELTKRAFKEMLRAGITTVGEFHYLHHDDKCAGFAYDDLVIQAARETGIRLVLLQAYYKSGGIDKPLVGGQQRFATRSLYEFWTQFDTLKSKLDPRTQSIGIVAHSIRACALDEIIELAHGAQGRGAVMHMHLEEQVRELQDCKQHYGKEPIDLLLENLELGPWFTAVHCTHTNEHTLRRYVDTGAQVCICPTTEANLGDGFNDLRAVWDRQREAICLGTDSNARIDMIEEMRWLEYVQRLRHQQRGVFCDEAGSVAGGLLQIASHNGAKALSLNAGAIKPGAYADFCVVEVGELFDADRQPFEQLVFASKTPSAARVCVAGKWVV